LKDWVAQQDHWRPYVSSFTLGILNEGLKDRAITRDLEWGITVPTEDMGSEKRIYVWFENVIGYLSAAKEWAQRRDQPEAWRPFWQDPEARSYYFLGKDNIFFHTMSWPMEIMSFGDADGLPLNLPYDVPANHFNNVAGRKASTSRSWAIWLPDLIDRYDPDSFRYYLCATMPESADSDFTWQDFVARNNNELVATFGNLVHRTLTMVYRAFDGRIPDPGQLDPRSEKLIAAAEAALTAVAGHLGACHFRAGLGAAMALAQDANRYLDETAPWKSLPSDKPSAARSLYTTLCVIQALKVCMSPFIPSACERLHGFIGYEHSLSQSKWELQRPPPEQRLREPQPLFAKLDPSVVTEEEERLQAGV
jgi:methionyl-tRNA synthetase